MSKLFGFHMRLGPPRLQIGLLAADAVQAPEAAPPKPPPKLYALSLPTKGGRPKVFEYDDDEAGRAQLANLIRGENVLSVILGNEVRFESTSVVDLQMNGKCVSDRYVLPGL